MSSPTWGEAAAAIAPAGTATGNGTGTGAGTGAGTEAGTEAGAAAAFGALGQFVGQPPLAGQFVIIYLMSDTQRRHRQWRQCVINVGVLSNLLNTGRETRASSTYNSSLHPRSSSLSIANLAQIYDDGRRFCVYHSALAINSFKCSRMRF